MLDIEKQKEHFKNHIAEVTDYGKVKILDFKNPQSSNYRIRFLFEEDYCKLHISGDLGELDATNYNNMTFEGFKCFTNNIGYFEEKIDCHSRHIYRYNEDVAREELKKIVEENDYGDSIYRDKTWCKSEEEAIEEFLDDALEDFDEDMGIGPKGYDVADEYICDFWEDAPDMGKESTGILELYMLAFKLAMEQIESNK